MSSLEDTSCEKFSDDPPASDFQVNISNTYNSPPAAVNSHMPDAATCHHLHARNPEPWQSGLLDCFSDPKSCCQTFWCPWITFGQVAEIVDKGSTSCFASGARYAAIACATPCPCPCIYSCFYRSKLRQQYSLEESPCGDCLVHCFCELCALCQEYRELESRGFNMSIGWHGNMDARNHEVGMGSVPPMVEGGMSRK